MTSPAATWISVEENSNLCASTQGVESLEITSSLSSTFLIENSSLLTVLKSQLPSLMQLKPTSSVSQRRSLSSTISSSFVTSPEIALLVPQTTSVSHCV